MTDFDETGYVTGIRPMVPPLRLRYNSLIQATLDETPHVRRRGLNHGFRRPIPYCFSSGHIDLIYEPVEPLDRLGDRELLARFLRTLGPKQRRAIYLRFWRRLTWREISQALGVSHEQVRILVNGAIRLFRRAFDLTG